jgi:hypothetical protein
MLQDYQTIKLWKELSNTFNVHVRNIEVGRTAIGNECTLVTVDEKTDPSVLATLPKEFVNEEVQYKTSGPDKAFLLL